MADELDSKRKAAEEKVKAAEERYKEAWAALSAASLNKIQNISSTKAVAAETAATKEVEAATTALEAAQSAWNDARGAKGGRRKHKAKGTKRRRHSGGFPDFRNILPPSLANLFGLSPRPPPPPPPSSAPALTPQQPGINGGKSGKKRKHSRRKY